jgi:hypothetical protein
LLLTSQVAFADDKNNASAVQFTADMAKYNSSAKVDELAFEGWVGTQLFAKAAAGLTNFDASTVLNAMKNLDAIDLPAIGGYQTKGVTSPLPALPQLLHTKVQAGVVKNGQIVDDGGFIDPFALLAAHKTGN